ncbi:hypothetical protein FA95DRAFT_124225 [Auriscalpium vulgare]|uniref:Uncharacterized protein n=1 Tax=Auriscalpium vulgare TaxID=40419 RepID=A0ACB8RNB5_9AGAM|nr:hypothetical protein FA95DRAFT_124225 [Auriscalpium vulgare]
MSMPRSRRTSTSSACVDAFWAEAAGSRVAELEIPSYDSEALSDATLTGVEERTLALHVDLEALREQQRAEKQAIERAACVVSARHTQRTAAIRQAIRALGTQRNELFPVSRIPPEILTRIFLLLSAVDSLVNVDNNRPGKRGLGWTRVTHVCRRWRGVALGDPTLWTYVPLALHRGMLDTMVLRAESCLLSLDCWPRHHDAQRNSEFLRKSISQARSVRLWVDVTGNLAYLDEVCAPFIQSLAVHIDTFHCHLPPNFLGGLVPFLRKLTIVSDHCLYPCYLQFTGNLGSMEVWHKLQGRHGNMRLFDILDALRCLDDSLETLVLDVGMFLPPADNISPPLVRLHMLRSLMLTCNVSSTASFLQFVEVPLACAVNLNLNCPTKTSQKDLQGIFTLLGKLIGSQSRQTASPVTVVHLKACTGVKEASVAVQGWRGDAHSSEHPAFHVTIPSRIDLPARLRLFWDLEEFVLGEDIRWEPHTWWETLGHAPRLRKVEAWGQSAFQLCIALITNINAAPGKNAQFATPFPDFVAQAGDGAAAAKAESTHRTQLQGFLPALTSLVLRQVQLDRLIEEVPFGDVLGNAKQPLSKLIVSRWLRKGSILKELDIETCSVSAESVNAFREAVPGLKVKWTPGPAVGERIGEPEPGCDEVRRVVEKRSVYDFELRPMSQQQCT